MASVVFIIRVPFKEDIKNSKAEDKTEREGNNQNDQKNVEEKKCEAPRKDEINGQANDVNQPDDTAEDVEILNNINWAKVLMQHNHCSKTIVTRTCLMNHFLLLTYFYNVFHLLIKVLPKKLRELKVQGDSWTVTEDMQFHQVFRINLLFQVLERLCNFHTYSSTFHILPLLPLHDECSKAVLDLKEL